MQKTTLYLAPSTHRRLRDLARRTERPQAELIREALEQYLAAAPTQLPPSIGTGSDEDLRGRDTEDWLGVNWRGR